MHWFGDDEPFCYTGQMDWAPDTDAVHRGKKTVLARRERPQMLMEQASAGSSYGPSS